MDAEENYPKEQLKIGLILGDINIQRARRDMQFIFINGRPVQNKSINFHVNQIYRLIAPEDSFPAFAVFIQMPAGEIDVNIHPTKREVKIKDEQALCSILRSLCEQTLLGKSKMKKARVKVSFPDAEEASTIDRALKKSSGLSENFDSASAQAASGFSSDDYAFPSVKSSGPKQEYFIPPESFFKKDDSIQSRLEDARFIGGFINKFLFFESGATLLVIDQHAAAERITFEQLIRQMQNSTIEVQNLLSPVVIKLSPQEMLIWEDAQQEMAKMGMENNQWDEESIAVHTQPLLFKDIERAVRYMLAGEKVEKSDFETLARRACRSSIMAGDYLNKEKAEFLREQLLQCLDPFTCPHGRPTVIEMTEDFLDKQFFRT